MTKNKSDNLRTSKKNYGAKARLVKARLVEDTRGLSTVEYLILLVVVAVAGISVWQSFGSAITAKTTTATTEINGLN